jgi:DNA-directed RNA polymerase subunit RPC12/RpoP
MAARVLRYYDDDWRSPVQACPGCGWSGTAAETATELDEELADYSCPACGRMLLIVCHPTLEEIVRAAGRGVEEAIEHLAHIRRAGRSPVESAGSGAAPLRGGESGEVDAGESRECG